MGFFAGLKRVSPRQKTALLSVRQAIPIFGCRASTGAQDRVIERIGTGSSQSEWILIAELTNGARLKGEPEVNFPIVDQTISIASL